jgi:hypothetical protein
MACVAARTHSFPSVRRRSTSSRAGRAHRTYHQDSAGSRAREERGHHHVELARLTEGRRRPSALYAVASATTETRSRRAFYPVRPESRLAYFLPRSSNCASSFFGSRDMFATSWCGVHIRRQGQDRNAGSDCQSDFHFEFLHLLRARRTIGRRRACVDNPPNGGCRMSAIRRSIWDPFVTPAPVRWWAGRLPHPSLCERRTISTAHTRRSFPLLGGALFVLINPASAAERLRERVRLPPAPPFRAL